LTALVGEKTVFQPFVFMILTALGVCVVVGHKVSMQSVACKARNIRHLPAHAKAAPASNPTFTIYHLDTLVKRNKLKI
jgi:hypothetical protein